MGNNLPAVSLGRSLPLFNYCKISFLLHCIANGIAVCYKETFVEIQKKLRTYFSTVNH